MHTPPSLTESDELLIDSPLLSLRRIVGALCLWAYFDAQGIWTREIGDEMLWTFLVYHRRPWAAYQKQLKG